MLKGGGELVTYKVYRYPTPLEGASLDACFAPQLETAETEHKRRRFLQYVTLVALDVPFICQTDSNATRPTEPIECLQRKWPFYSQAT